MTKNEIADWVMLEMNASLKLRNIGGEDNPTTVRSYSGRGMYGKECPSISVESLSDALIVMFDVVAAAHSELSENDAETVLSALSSISTDSMGLGQVFYWRGLSQ